MHIGYEQLRSDMAGVLKDADAVGAKTIINPYLPHKAEAPRQPRGDPEGRVLVREVVEGRARPPGKRFGYHVHGQEFGKAPEGTLFDVLAKESGPDVGFEADVYWVACGRRRPGRADEQVPGPRLVHAPQGHGEGPRPRCEETHSAELEGGARHGPDRRQGDRRRRREGRRRDELHRGRERGPRRPIPQSVAYYKSL